MASTSRLYNALNEFLRQCDIQWQDARHLQTLCWMIIGMIESQNVHLNGFGVYVVSRAQIAQSHQRRFRRWLSNRRIDVASAHHALVKQALSGWKNERLYLSLDTTLVWNCFCIVWVGVVYRGRTVPVAVGEWWRNRAAPCDCGQFRGFCDKQHASCPMGSQLSYWQTGALPMAS